MSVRIASGWKDYQLLDSGGGERLEQWGPYCLIRPDPQVIWPRSAQADWSRWDGRYERSAAGGGKWEFRRKLPPEWVIRYRSWSFLVRPTNFKHTGLFPEQAVNWDWLEKRLRRRQESGQKPSVINLFGYTGAATVAAASTGAEVCHVDAAKGMVQWCRENVALNGLAEAPVRYLVEDCFRYVQREIRRERTYDAIILDPPSYGRGKGGEMWKLEDQLWNFLQETRKLLSSQPLAVVLNTYTAYLSSTVMENLLRDALDGLGGHFSTSEIALPSLATGRPLPGGSTVLWEAD